MTTTPLHEYVRTGAGRDAGAAGRHVGGRGVVLHARQLAGQQHAARQAAPPWGESTQSLGSWQQRSVNLEMFGAPARWAAACGTPGRPKLHAGAAVGRQQTATPQLPDLLGMSIATTSHSSQREQRLSLQRCPLRRQECSLPKEVGYQCAGHAYQSPCCTTAKSSNTREAQLASPNRRTLGVDLAVLNVHVGAGALNHLHHPARRRAGGVLPARVLWRLDLDHAPRWRARGLPQARVLRRARVLRCARGFRRMDTARCWLGLAREQRVLVPCLPLCQLLALFRAQLGWFGQQLHCLLGRQVWTCIQFLYAHLDAAPTQPAAACPIRANTSELLDSTGYLIGNSEYSRTGGAGVS